VKTTEIKDHPHMELAAL